RARGAEVVLITGPTALSQPAGIASVRIETTAELQAAVQEAIHDATVLIMAAAPADFRPATRAAKKQPRSKGGMTLALEPTPDILASLRRPAGLMVIGFALETGNGLANARKKLQQKQLDYVVLNDALEPGAGFEVTTNKVTLLGKNGTQVDLPLLEKRDVAQRILDTVEQTLT